MPHTGSTSEESFKLRRRLPQIADNTTESSKSSPKYDLADDVALLKEQVAALQKRLNTLEQRKPKRSSLERQFLTKPVTQIRRGPKQRHADTIYKERDMFVRLLERLWLEIEPLCGQWSDDGKSLIVAPNMTKITRVLKRVRDDPHAFQMAEVAASLIDRISFMRDFLTEPPLRKVFTGDPRQAINRTTGNPRQLANGLAGVPRVSIWRSLKLCGDNQHQCKVDIADEALPTYVRRKHPLLARALSADSGLPHLSSFMRTYARRHDIFLRSISAKRLSEICSSLRKSPIQ